MSNKEIKIAVIGGGSSYTPELIEGLIDGYEEFPVTEVYLVDIEEGLEKLNIVGAFAQRMIDAAKMPIKLYTTLDRRKAIAGADFVITQLRVGQLEARIRDEKIPLRYGCIGQETTGAGGFAKALRTIPVILSICRDIEELAPNAFLVNFTNPAGIITEAVIKHSKVRAIGLCNLPIGIRMDIAKELKLPLAEVEIEMVGINHLNWTTKVFAGHVEVTDQIIYQVENKDNLGIKNIPDFKWDPVLLRSLGAIPCGYHKYYYMKEEIVASLKEQAATVGTRGEVVKKLENELFELYKDPMLSIKPPQLAQRGGAYYSIAAINLMSSIYNDKKDIQIVNVRNNGAIPCLPDDASIEINCVIDRQGARPVQIMAQMTSQRRGLLQIVKAYEELTIEAAVKGDLDVALQALIIHPLVGSAVIAQQMLEDIISENKEYLPQF